MIGYRSTGLRLAAQHCPRALDFFEQGAPQDRRRFEVGIAAHAVLQAVAEQTNILGRQLDQDEVDRVAGETAERLISVGRMFDGVSEPPLGVDAALAGRDLAVAFLFTFWPESGADVEIGLAVDAQGHEVDYYHPSARVRAILDYAAIEEVADEESATRALVVLDYKSSWAADAAELETIQRKIQAVLAVEHYRGRLEFDHLRLTVANLRTKQLHHRDVPLVDGGSLTIDRWRADIFAFVESLDAQKRLGNRPAIVGATCVGCPYVLRCDEAQHYMADAGIPGTARARAVAYSAAHATLQELSEAVRVDVDGGELEVPGGVVGYHPKEQRQLRRDAFADLWREWEETGGEGAGFAKAAALTVGNAEAIAKQLYQEREQRPDRERFVASLVEPKVTKQFGVYRLATQEGGSDAAA